MDVRVVGRTHRRAQSECPGHLCRQDRCGGSRATLPLVRTVPRPRPSSSRLSRTAHRACIIISRPPTHTLPSHLPYRVPTVCARLTPLGPRVERACRLHAYQRTRRAVAFVHPSRVLLGPTHGVCPARQPRADPLRRCQCGVVIFAVARIVKSSHLCVVHASTFQTCRDRSNCSTLVHRS